MEIIHVKNYEELSEQAAKIVSAQILKKPNSTIILPTGSTPIGMYDLLVKKTKNSLLDWKEIQFLNLDEYVGLNKNSFQSYHYYMKKHFFNFINATPNNIHIPDGIGNLDQNILNYQQLFNDKGPADLTILGIGVNGHIGFQEPGASVDTTIGVVSLSNSTIKANAIHFKNCDSVPKQAITLGIKEIMKSKKIVLLISGRKKSQAFQATVYGPVTKNVPASYLQNHPNVVVIVDRAAAYN